jgi:hypothetical protein
LRTLSALSSGLSTTQSIKKAGFAFDEIAPTAFRPLGAMSRRHVSAALTLFPANGVM